MLSQMPHTRLCKALGNCSECRWDFLPIDVSLEMFLAWLCIRGSTWCIPLLVGEVEGVGLGPGLHPSQREGLLSSQLSCYTSSYTEFAQVISGGGKKKKKKAVRLDEQSSHVALLPSQYFQTCIIIVWIVQPTWMKKLIWADSQNTH